ncbi:MAG: triose-phosphate isomerase [Acidimicrobiales bacterium]
MNRPALTITPPFFELGPKAYCWGKDLLRLALLADKLSANYGVQVIMTPQYVDIPLVAREVEHVLVFAQHMDSLRPGRGIGRVLPEALREAGALGVMLNHAEHPLTRAELVRAVNRAHEVGLATMVCADDPAEAVSIAHLGPNVIILEAPELIASGVPAGFRPEAIARADEGVRSVDPGIQVLHGAGIVGPSDIYDVIAAGASGSGSSSAVFTAKEPSAALEAMIKAAREAWDARNQGGPTK